MEEILIRLSADDSNTVQPLQLRRSTSSQSSQTTKLRSQFKPLDAQKSGKPPNSPHRRLCLRWIGIIGQLRDTVNAGPVHWPLVRISIGAT